MASPSDLGYLFTIRISGYGFGGKPMTVVAADIRGALRKLVFRRFPKNDRPHNLTVADSIYEAFAYEVLGQVPRYSDIFRPELDPNWGRKEGPTLRDIAKDMEDMENIKDVLNEED